MINYTARHISRRLSEYFLKIRIMQWLTELQDLKYVQHGVLLKHTF